MSNEVSRDEYNEILSKLDKLAERREVRLSDIRIPLVSVVVGLLALGSPAAMVIANHYKIAAHLENTAVHAIEKEAQSKGGIAYAADVNQKERRYYFLMRAIHCGTANAVPALCSSSYPDGDFPSIRYSDTPWRKQEGVDQPLEK